MEPLGAPHEAAGVDAEVQALLAGGRTERAVALALERLLPPMGAWLRSVLAEPDAREALELFRAGLPRELSHFRWDRSLRAWAFELAVEAAHRVHRRPRRRGGGG